MPNANETKLKRLRLGPTIKKSKQITYHHKTWTWPLFNNKITSSQQYYRAYLNLNSMDFNKQTIGLITCTIIKTMLGSTYRLFNTKHSNFTINLY